MSQPPFIDKRLIDTLSVLAQQTAPGQTALMDRRGALAYSALADGVSALAIWLQDQQVAVVALRAGNSIDWVLVDLACQVAGLMCLPLPEFFSDEQSQHCLQAANADLLLSDELAAVVNVCELGGHSLDSPPPLTLDVWRLTWPEISLEKPVHPAGTQKITFTSGSTGSPKGVCLSQDQQWQVAESLAEVIALKQPRHLCLLPLATLLENIAGVYTPLLCGGTVILPDAASRGLRGSSGLDIQGLIQCISHYQPHSLILLPQLLNVLIAACQGGWQPPASLKFVAVGGAKVAVDSIVQARSYGIPVYEGYGLSECGSVVALNTPGKDKPGAVGKPLPHCDVTIDNGEIMVAGSAHLGYLGQPENWFPSQIATGDLGTLDDGWLSITGRRKNVLISSFGRNISPEWVESALCTHSLLAQCVVLGDARPYLIALLSAPATVSDAVIGEWIENANQHLPDYAQVKAWHRLDQHGWQGMLTANGRPQRQLIMEHYADLIERIYTSNPHVAQLCTPGSA
ncbi:MAG: hypothetical protein DRR06_16265 [Gammaproteobacteria bacterium]|nr:MAG: hypothetical protein DRR06_16265 [Gammaproteobacteria bacterium]